MALPNTFDNATTQLTLTRLEKLTPASQPQWGKMNAAQMLAHLNIPYDIAYGRVSFKPSFFVKLMLKWFVKDSVTSEKPYVKNSRTAPLFLISDEREFEKEKNRLIANIRDTEAKGASYFEGKESASFGKMTASEWSNQFYKHIDHHFTQFGI